MTRRTLFHLAIPCRDLDETAGFYQALGCRVARRYHDRVTLEFFGDQVVCHLSPDHVDPEPQMYPRHFGVTFLDRDDFLRLLSRCREAGLRFFAEPSLRFAGRREAHEMFFLLDPSNNVLEFKCYDDPGMAH